jgi:hypothetical protein
MSRRLRRTAAAAYAASVVAVMTVPTVLLTHAAHRGSAMPTWRETGLVAVSVTVGAGYGVVAYRRLSRTPAPTSGRGDGWVAAVGALVVLALLTPALLGVTLYQLGPLQVPMADRLALLYLVWATVHLACVSAGELFRRLMMRWLR